MSVGTASLPDSRVDNLYSARLRTYGRTTEPVRWTVTAGALPQGLVLPEDESWRVTGVTTEAGTYGFTVTATDSSSPPQVASKQLSVRVDANGQGNGALAGRYVFVLQERGWSPTLEFYGAVGRFDADGNGAVTNGEVDLTYPGMAGHYTFTGSYGLGPDLRGTLNLAWSPEDFSPASAWLAVSLGSVSQGVAHTGFGVGGGMFGNASIVIRKQSDEEFTAASMNGGFALMGTGKYSFLGDVALGGQVTFSGDGQIAGGVMDVGAAPPVTDLAGTYALDSNGRGTATLNVGSQTTYSLTYYAVSSSEYLFLGTEALQNGALLGRAKRQTGTAFSTASLSGRGVWQMEGSGFAAGEAQAGLLTFDGQGSFAFEGQTIGYPPIVNDVTRTGVYDVSANGRATASDAGGSYLLYLVSPTEAFAFRAADLSIGTFLRQAELGSGTYPTGEFIFGPTMPMPRKATDITISGLADFQNGVERATTDSGAVDRWYIGSLSTPSFVAMDDGTVILEYTCGAPMRMYMVSPTEGYGIHCIGTSVTTYLSRDAAP